MEKGGNLLGQSSWTIVDKGIKNVRFAIQWNKVIIGYGSWDQCAMTRFQQHLVASASDV